MSFTEYARNELIRAGAIDPNNPDEDQLYAKQVLELVAAFEAQKHNSGQHNTVVELFSRLLYGQPIMPLTGEDDEWLEVFPGKWQNKRCAAVVKHGEDAFFSEAYVFENPLNGQRVINMRSWGKIVSWPFYPRSIVLRMSSPEAIASAELPSLPGLEASTPLPLKTPVELLREMTSPAAPAPPATPALVVPPSIPRFAPPERRPWPDGVQPGTVLDKIRLKDGGENVNTSSDEFDEGPF